MTPSDDLLLARLRRQLPQMTEELGAAYLKTFRAISRLLTPAELDKAMSDGTLNRLVVELLRDDVLDPELAPLRALLGQVGLEAARQQARLLPAGIQSAFNVLNPRTIEAARTLQTAVIESLKADIRESVRVTVAEGLQAGVNPRVVARRAFDNVGLPPNYARAVETFRTQLETGDRAALRRVLARGVATRPDGSTFATQAHAGGRGLTDLQLATLERKLGRQALTPREIDTLTTAYRKRLEGWHADTIARTAAIDAQRLGQHAAWQDAIDRGIVDATRVWKRWRTVGDSRVRDEHRDMDGTEVRFNEAFPTGEILPGENTFNCRCRAVYFTKVAERALEVAA
jgi:hypothetical protein